MAKRNIRVRHRRTRSTSRTPPVVKKPAKILAPDPSPLPSEVTAVAKKDGLKDVKDEKITTTAPKMVEPGNAASKNNAAGAKAVPRCAKCGQKMTGQETG
jgi:hypothetical protein